MSSLKGEEITLLKLRIGIVGYRMMIFHKQLGFTNDLFSSLWTGIAKLLYVSVDGCELHWIAKM